MDRRAFLTGLVAVAVAPALPSVAVGDGVALTTIAHPVTWMDIPGTDMALRGSPDCIAAWMEVFDLKEAGIPYPSALYGRALFGDWEYIASPNYIERTGA